MESVCNAPTVEKIGQLKKQAEKEISGVLNRLERETGTKISGLGFRAYHNWYNVSLELENPFGGFNIMSRPSSSSNSKISSSKFRRLVLLASVTGAALIAAILALLILIGYISAPWWQVLLCSAVGATLITVLLTLFAP
jgi:hypothetical protein